MKILHTKRTHNTIHISGFSKLINEIYDIDYAFCNIAVN